MLTLAELPAEADAYPLLARRVKKEKLYEKKGPRAFAKRSAFESFEDYLDKTYRLRRKNMQGIRRLRKRLAFTRPEANYSTSGGLVQKDLMMNKKGKVVITKFSNRPWIKAVVQARKILGVKGFAAVKKGTDLYKKAKELYELSKRVCWWAPLVDLYDDPALSIPLGEGALSFEGARP